MREAVVREMVEELRRQFPQWTILQDYDRWYAVREPSESVTAKTSLELRAKLRARE